MAEENASEAASPVAGEDISLVKDVSLQLQVVLGEASLSIQDIIKCGKGSVIPLNRKVGDPFIIKLQNKVIAEGEVVEVGESLGIKITNVIKPM